MKNLLLILSTIFMFGVNAQTPTNLTKAISAVNVHRFVEDYLNVPITSGSLTDAVENGKIILDYDRTYALGEAGISELISSTGEKANSAQQLIITATLDEQSRVKSINYPGKNYEINYKDGEISYIKSSKYKSTGGFVFTGDKVTSLEGQWNKSGKKFSRLLTKLRYNASGHLIEALESHQPGKGKDFSSITPGKQKLLKSISVTIDRSKSSITWEVVEFDPNKKNIIKSQFKTHSSITNKTLSHMDLRGKELVKTRETDYDDQWRPSEMRLYTNNKVGKIVKTTYDEQNRIDKVTSGRVEDGKMMVQTITEYGPVTKDGETEWDRVITRHYDQAGNVTSEDKGPKTRIKNPDGSWNAWKFRTS